MDTFNNSSVQDLNMDCWRVVLECLEIQDFVHGQAVSRGWRDMVHQYLQEVHGYILFMPGSIVQVADKKSRVLRVSDCRVLAAMLRNIGRDMVRLTTDGDRHWLSAIAENCPNLREVTLYNVQVLSNDELRSLLRGCTLLEKVIIRSSKWVEDDFAIDLTNIKHLEIDRNQRITGSFLSHLPSQLDSLSLRECSALEYYNIEDNIQKLSTLTTLFLDECPGIFSFLHELIQNLPQLQELSLSHYTEGNGEELAESISRLGDLRKLRVRQNGAVDDRFVETVVRGCLRLEALDIAACKGVTKVSMPAIANCHLQHLDVSSIELTDKGLEVLTQGPALRLQTFRLAQNADLSQRTIYGCIKRFADLTLLDVRGIPSVSHLFVRNAAGTAGRRAARLTLLAAVTSIQPEDLEGISLTNLVVDLDWPTDEPWERYFHNADDQYDVLENYADLNFDQPPRWQYAYGN